MSGVTNYPNASIDELRAQYAGRLLEEVELEGSPLAVIDVAVARRNCQLMLDTADALGVRWRSHVKSHKTVELSKLQVGEKADTVRLVVSTLAEAEQLRPYLEECKAKGRSTDLVYGLPVQPSCFKRLAALGKALGHGSISVLVDSLEILPFLDRYYDLTAGQTLKLYVKLDTGNYRAGIPPESAELKSLLAAIKQRETELSLHIRLQGFYSHMGLSYGSETTQEALDYLAQEIERCSIATEYVTNVFADSSSSSSSRRFTISVGATPTATSAQNLLSPNTTDAAVKRVKDLIARVQQSHDIELHAGAYVTLDMQQMAAHARPSFEHRSYGDIAVTLLAEVGSLYPQRSPPEALVACGMLSLGREPCRNYPGWGVITPWDHVDREKRWSWYDSNETNDRTGWIVSRVSQEHGILTWQGDVAEKRPLQVGQRVLIWPNHCCIALAGYSFVLVVDSDREGREKERVIDVYLSWRGW